jgi:TRAP transporter 4TM/12TM fusion protein
MAAAAFVMADLVGMPYLAIAAAALLPAVFKYLSLFAQVYAEAVRLNLPPIPRDQLPVLNRMDWMRFLLILLPVAALMTAFLTGSSPSRAGLIGVATAIVAGFVLNPDFRRRPRLVIEALSAGGVSAGQILVAVGAIGIVLAVVNETGIGIRFALQISAIGEGNLLLALLLAMAASLILGMGLPTLPAYLIMGIMLAPALIRSGVEPVAAHLFVLYYAVYASLVPPIAYGCYIAAPIAGANPLATSFVALRISLVGLAVPFVFVYSPSLLLVNSAFSWGELAFACMQLLVAIYLLATAAGGADPFDRRLSLPSRGLRAAFGILALVPSGLIAGAAAAVTLALIILPLVGLRRARTNQT